MTLDFGLVNEPCHKGFCGERGKGHGFLGEEEQKSLYWDNFFAGFL
jgi:hypothetical protein